MVARAGSLLGKRVLVTGCGPIGALTIIAARVLDCYEQGRAHAQHDLHQLQPRNG